jgi:hypothetical protein
MARLITDPPWTDDEVATLTKMYGENLSAQKIADGIGRTRNAVIGKINRLRLNKVISPLRPQKPGPKPKPTVKAKIAQKRERVIVIKDDTPAIEPPVRTQVWEPLPDSNPVIVEHHKVGCRWPIGDRPVLFCNASVSGKQVYCPTHQTMGTRPSPQIVFKGRRR